MGMKNSEKTRQTLYQRNQALAHHIMYLNFRITIRYKDLFINISVSLSWGEPVIQSPHSGEEPVIQSSLLIRGGTCDPVSSSEGELVIQSPH